jgi:hypothetical protein
MTRRLLIAVVAPIMGAALIAPAAASADPTTPAPGGSTPTPAPVTTPPAAPPATDTGTVCKNLGTTLKGGWPAFQATLQQAKTQVGQRDLGAAQASVKQAGQQLQALGGQVKQDGSQATDATLKNTTAEMGDQLTNLGGSLNSLTKLNGFNPGRLAPLSKQLSTTCKGELSGVPLPG